MGKISFRTAEATDHDAELFCNLSNSLYARKVSKLYFYWQFFSPAAPTRTAFAFEGTTLLGSFSYQMRRVEPLGRWTALAIDIMISGEAQGRGLLKDLESFAHSLTLEFSPLLHHVFGNARAKDALSRKYGWTIQREITDYEVEMHARAKPSAKTEFQEIKSDFASAQDFSHNNPGILFFERSPAWMQWRFEESPRYRYEVQRLGNPQKSSFWAVTKEFRDPATSKAFLDVVDLFGKNSVSAMQKTAFAELQDQRDGVLTTWCSGNPAEHGLKASPRQRWWLWRGSDATFELSEKDWYLSMADTEVY